MRPVYGLGVLIPVALVLAFELDAYLHPANAQFVVSRKSTPIDRARRALERRLAGAPD